MTMEQTPLPSVTSFESERELESSKIYPTPDTTSRELTTESDSKMDSKKQEHEKTIKPTKGGRKKKPTNFLTELLEDASRYDPNCDYSLPTSYKRTRNERHYPHIDLYPQNGIIRDDENESVKSKGIEKTKNQSVPNEKTASPKRKRRLIRATELIAKKKLPPIKDLSEQKPSIIKSKRDDSSKVKEIVNNQQPPRKRGRPFKNKVKTEITKEESPKKKRAYKKRVKVEKRENEPIPNSDNSKENSPSIENKVTDIELPKDTNKTSNNKPMEKNLNKQSLNTDEGSDFIDWDEPLIDINDDFFNIEALRNQNFFNGEIIDSKLLTESHYMANYRGKNAIRSHQNSDIESESERSQSPLYFVPKTDDIVVHLKNPLFFNHSEAFIINFSRDTMRYNAMAEIGRTIEYLTMIYLPETYAQHLKKEIIPALNIAFDKSNDKQFVEIIEKYNEYILTIPRNEIIDHLQTVKKVPLSFIHDFLQIVYTRSIHPHANKLKHYKAFSNYVYGELLPKFLSNVYKQCGLNKSSVFLDLGSGVGNCVIQAAIEYGCKFSAGCEIMPEASNLTEIQYKELQGRCKLMGINLRPVQFFLRESFVDNENVDTLVKDCDVILINNFLFDSELNAEVEKIIQNAKVGCKIISLKSLRSVAYVINFDNVENVMSRLKIEKFNFDEDSVSWTHTGGEYYISTVLDSIDETLLEVNNRFRNNKREFRYTR